MRTKTNQVVENRGQHTRRLPEGWLRIDLPYVVDINMGQSPPGTSYNSKGEGVPFYQGKADFGERYPIPRVWCTKPKKIAKPGDVLVSVRAPVGPTNVAYNKCIIGRGLAALTPLGGIPTEFVLFALRFLEPKLALSGTGSTFTAISKKDLQGIRINVPPLAEQERIVAKVEELLARVNEARERLARVQEILKRFRQSVLAAACSGRLTADWREERPDSLSVKAILDDIKRQRLEQATTPAQREKGRAIYTYKEEENSDQLPVKWEYVALDKLCESFQYGTSKKSNPSGKVPVLRMGNIQNGRIDWKHLVYTSDDAEIERYKLNPGDVLFNRTNSPELVGKTAIYAGEQPSIFAGYLIRINNLEQLNPEYLNYCLNSLYGREFCSKTRTDGVSQSNINAHRLGKFEVPFCSKEEQQEIVQRVESLFKLSDVIEKRVTAANQRVEKLTQAILAKAFRGELVPTEAELASREGRSYEPASALLAKIKAQKKGIEAQQKEGRSNRKRK